MPNEDHPNAHILRYDQHMPEIDDLTLIILKGHLLVEETLHQAKAAVLSHSECLEDARLSFAQTALVVRAAATEVYDHKGWQLVTELNKLRNALVHALEPPKLEKLIARCVEVYFDAKVQYEIDYEPERHWERPDQLRNVIVDCMFFLRCIWWRRQEIGGKTEAEES